MLTVHYKFLRFLSLATVLLMGLVYSVNISAQTPPPPPATPPDAATTPPVATQSAPTSPSPSATTGDFPVAGVIRRETRLVLVDTVVTDKKGNYIRDLTQKDFKVFEDNKEQTILSFSMGTDQTIQANNGQ